MSDLQFTRILSAPRALVWDCWTKPEHLKHWFCPAPHSVTKAVIDLRAGGQFLTVMKVGNDLYPNDGSFLEVVDQEKLVFTDMMRADFAPVAAPGLGFCAIITLADHPDGTEYTALARHRDEAGAKAHVDMGFYDGWTTAAKQLETYAKTLKT